MMSNVTNEPRVHQLKEILDILADEIDARPGARDMASLIKQYRETIKEIEEIEGAESNGDEIAEILNSRDGQPGTVRTNRA